MATMTLSQAMELAWKQQQSGHLEQAEGICQRVLAHTPQHAPALHLMGVLAKLAGKDDLAIDLLRKAVALQPGDSTAHSNLGNVLRDSGQFEAALDAYRQAILLRPTFPIAFYNMGLCLWQMHRDAEAIDNFRQAIRLNPRFADAYIGLAAALKDIGEIDESIVAARSAIQLNPNVAAFHRTLGGALELKGPAQLEQAVAAFNRAIQLDPGYVDAYCDLALALTNLNLHEQSAAALDRAAALSLNSALIHETRGRILSRTGNGAEAVNSFRRALEIDPDSASAWINLGQVLRQIGRFGDAADCIPQILARRADAPQAYALMAALGQRLQPADIARLSASLDDPRMSVSDRAALGFALGKFLDDADRFDEAFAHFARANALVLQIRRAAGERYDSQVYARQVDEWIAQSTPDFFSRVRGWGEPSELPVFIVGMPRSGTTLVEQIASSHPDVFGAGELKDISAIAASLGSGEFQPGPIHGAAQRQLNRLRALGGAALRVIDKMPDNVEHLPLIATLFPSSRVILCRRDPRDTCLSCYFQRFASGNLFSFDLAECGRHHVQVERLISHWRKVLPLPILEVQYEDLVADLETQSRRLTDFLGLPWNPACLDFHNTQRTVQTASAWQVRQPIYTRSVGRWRNYQRHLGPLLEALGLNG